MFKFKAKNSLVYKKRATQFAISLFRYCFLIGITYLLIFPILYMLITAFQSPATASDPTVVWIPRSLSLAGIKKAFELLNYGRSALLSLEITVLSTLCAIASCSLAGYGLARFNFKGKSICFGLVLLTIIIPPQVMFTSNYLLYRFFDFGGLLSIFGISINLLESPMVFVLPAIFACGLRNGIFIYVFYSFFKGLPVEMEEAAKIDGCGVFRTFVQIMLPMAVPAFITVLLFSIVWHWTDYYSASTYFTQDLRPLVVMLKNLFSAIKLSGVGVVNEASSHAVRMYLQSGALLTIAPPLILYIFTQKYFTESIERTGLVG